MEVDVQAPLKQALAKAKTFAEAKDWAKAASAYEKAATLMSTWAEQAHGREAEERRKKMAIEYRAIAQRLRSGEVYSDPPARSSESTSDKEPASKVGAGGEIKSIVSNLSHASKITWEDIGGLDETKNEIKFALGMTLAQHPAGVKIAAWTRILFYGPPGTGKTLLAAATSNAVKSTEGVPSVFYNVKVSSILSKYFGESCSAGAATRATRAPSGGSSRRSCRSSTGSPRRDATTSTSSRSPRRTGPGTSTAPCSRASRRRS
ncbi:MAG: ATP-binding protein [Planctomycetes bacterium]|nr:ATP-binding protein [Planctomycetota bacterium]